MSRAKSILIIDDEPKIRALFRSQLREAGFHAFEADSGREALRLLVKKKIDLTVLDILLPESNGLEIFDEMKKKYPEIKIIVSSVHPAEDQQFLISGADAYYSKSESIAFLIDKIKTILGG